MCKKRAIYNFNKPLTIRELRSSLSVMNYCSGFIPKLSKKSKMLNAILKGKSKRSIKKIEWTPEKELAFKT
jgi:hypothetical protein